MTTYYRLVLVFIIVLLAMILNQIMLEATLKIILKWEGKVYIF